MMLSLRQKSMFTTAIVAVTLLATGVNPHVLSATEESELKVIPNPHVAAECNGATSSSSENEKDPSASSSTFFDATASSYCDTSFLLSPHRIIRAPMITQPDTLVEVTTRKVLSVPVPVYRFRQPARLSPSELPFQLVLVSDIDAAADALHAIPVDPTAAADSWFVGYSWSPVVYAGCRDSGPIHVGWKFTKNDNNASGEFFYALIVDSKEEAKSAVRVGIDTLGEVIAESFSIGTRAPAWMIDLLTKL